MKPTDIAPFACIDEVALYLGVSYATVRRQIAIGALPAMRIGRCIRIKWTDVYDFVDVYMMSPGMDDPEDDLEGNLDDEAEFEDEDFKVIDLAAWKASHSASSRRRA